MKLYQRILLPPAIALFFLLLFGGVSYSALRNGRIAMDELYQTRFALYQKTAEVSADIDTVHAGVYRLVTWIGNYDDAKIARATAEMTRQIDHAVTTVKGVASERRLTEDEQQQLETITGHLTTYKRHVTTALDLASVDVNTGLAALQTADMTFQELRKTIDALVESEKGLALKRYDEARAANSRAVMLALVVFVLAILGAGSAAAIVVRVVTRQLGGEPEYAAQIARRVAEGDLTVSIAVGEQDRSSVLSAMKSMVERLGQVVGEVRTSAAGLTSASSQVTSTAQSLSQGTSEQAASVEETTSALEEMNASITQNAENSRLTEQMASKGAREAEESGQTVRETGVAMKRIAEKVSIIQEIAYQTNLLALNAAIEAARAGQHGRGFAVVASEVRRLAERSQAAAKEINALASSSVSVAERSGVLLDELVPSIRKTADLVQEVAAASQEQASGVSQINKAMSQVDQVTQRNAAAAEELASTAEEMAAQAETLEQTVGFFRLGTVEQGWSRRPTAVHSVQTLMPAAVRLPTMATIVSERA